ncbi:MAG: hypothetical protein KDB07_09915, partial [Planctomycetes bacterium]|nr:hypothetical protein [Planctomycetota bacterium]
MEDKKSGPEFTRDQQSVASQLYAKTVELIDTLRPDLYRYCYSLTANPFDAEDLVQETLAKALSRLSQ